MESSESRPPNEASRIPSPLQSVGLVVAALVVLMLGHALFQVVAATLFFSAEQQAQMADPEVSLFLNHPLWIVMGTAVPHLALGGALLALVVRAQMPLEEVLPLKVPKVVSLVGALMVVFGLTPLADVVYGVVHRLFEAGVTADATVILERTLAGAGPGRLVGVVIGFALVPALVEESLFRGLVTAAHRHSFWAALLAPAVLFGLIHGEPAQVAATMVLGVAFGLARLFSGSLFTAIFAHAAYNTVVIIVAHMDHETINAMPSTAAVIAGVLFAIVGVLLLPMGSVPSSRERNAKPRASDE